LPENPQRPLVSRRDFLNGALLAAGGLAVRDSIPAAIFAAAAPRSCDGPIGADPRALRGGDLPDEFRIGHWMRDRRLTFARRTVTLASGCDGESGTFDIVDDDGRYDVVIAGGGIAGLSTAFYLLRRRPAARILILDAHKTLGGNSRRDDEAPIPVMASTGGSYCVAPYADFQRELYGAVGLAWERYKVAAPFYTYYFDDRTPGVLKGHRGWNRDTYGKGLRDVPYSAEVVRQLVRCRDDFLAWGSRDGAPTDPADASDPKYDYLSRMSLDEYLTKELHCDPIVSDFFTRYTVDALGGTTAQVNAHSSISFLGAEFADLFAFPGGNAGLARLLAKWLDTDCISGDPVTSMTVNWAALDRPEKRVRIRQDSVVVRADEDSLVYHHGGRFYRVAAKAMVLAGGSHTAQHLVAHLSDNARRAAWRSWHTVPVVVANVAVRSAAPFVDAGCGYNQYWWGSEYWADFIIADWVSSNRGKRDRPTVLTFFGGNTAGPGAPLAAERLKLLNTPFGDYEKSIRDDLSRVMNGTSFDVDRDVTAIYIYRWGHGMTMPVPDHVFGTADRAASPRRIAAAPLGRIVFAGQETAGTPSVESAMASGQRAAEQVLSLIP
jgi:spermidine dehydrogenase